MSILENDRLLFNVRKTLFEMLIDRGYGNNQQLFDVLKINFDDIKVPINLNDFQLELRNAADTETTLVKFTLVKFEKSQLAELVKYAQTLDKQGPVNIIVVLSKLSSTMLNIGNSMATDKIFIELWNIIQLEFNPIKSHFVPQHRIMDSKEVDEIMKTYNIKQKKLMAKIEKNDPIARYYGARSGQVFEITRMNENVGKSLFYRVVSG